MVLSFTMLEAATCRRKNNKKDVLSHVLDKPTYMADWFAGLPANHEVPSSTPALVAGSV